MKKVIYFGQKGSYSEKAMLEVQKLYDFSDYELESSSYIDEIIFEVANSDDVIGVLPIENSSAGVVSEIYGLLVEFENYITEAGIGIKI